MREMTINVVFEHFYEKFKSTLLEWNLNISYILDGIFCVSDGWGSPYITHEYASVYVQAWKFSPSDILFSRTDTRGSVISVSPTIPLPGPFDIDSHIFLVQVNLRRID